jgi:anaerobic selenocysteine-containing dehydrogenase
MTDTARYADVLLPSTTQLEHFDIVGSWGHHYISLNERAVAPLGESLSHGEVARRLARRLGLTHPAFYESDEQIAAAALPDGVTIERLRERGWLKSSPPRPAFVRGAALRLSDEVPVPARPMNGWLQLLTPKSHFFLNTTFANMPRQRAAMKRPTLEMHPVDAAARNLTEGQAVEVRNERGSVRAWLTTTDSLHAGVVALPGKWWSMPPDTAANANMLSASRWAPHGQPAFNDTFVEVIPAGGATSE